jgi:hypothetical protein
MQDVGWVSVSVTQQGPHKTAPAGGTRASESTETIAERRKPSGDAGQPEGLRPAATNCPSSSTDAGNRSLVIRHPASTMRKWMKSGQKTLATASDFSVELVKQTKPWKGDTVTELLDELRKVRQRIEKYGSKGINEQDTKATLIQPVLRALGWDVEDLEDVQREFKQRKQDKPVDYALSLLRTPCLFVEAKALGENLEDRKWANQIMGYAGVAGVGWVVLTDGNEYRLYNTHATVPIEEKLFRTVRIADNLDTAANTLALLSKKRMTGNEIDALWNAFFVDRQVKSVMEDMFQGEPDAALVRLLVKRLPGLTPKVIRSSVQRAELKIDFPLEPGEALDKSGKTTERTAKAKSVKKPGKVLRKRTKTSDCENSLDLGVPKVEQVALLMKAGYIKAGQVIRAHYHGIDLEATITKDGKVLFEGAVYQTLSAAGAAAKNHVSRKGYLATDGWMFWEMDDGNGNRVPLKVPRRDYIAKNRA